MAAINKSFVIKNGLEVNTNLIFADAPEGKVGIGTTNPEYLLHVKGGIGATDSFVSGISTTGVLHVGTAGTVITATAAGSVGLGTTNPQYKLQVIGGIGVTDSFVTGVSTVLTELRVGTGGTVLTVLGVGNSIGVGTASPQYLFHINSPVSTGQTALYVQGDVRITGDLSVDDITFDEASLTNLYVSGIGTIVNGFITNLTGTAGTITTFNSTNSTITNLNVTGIATIAILNATGIGVTNFTVYDTLSVGGTSTFTNGPVLIGSGTSTGTESQRLQVTGGAYVSGNTGIGSTNPTSKLDVIGDVRVTGVITATTFIGNVSAGVGTITTLSSTNGNITNLTGTAATIGTVQIVSGIITATSGIVTYYGDGQYLDLTNNPSTGIGIGTTGGVVGYGITFLDLKGAGVSTTQYNSSTGIATIFFEGGGGGGSISISTTAPISPGSGDLWYSPDYGRTFIYYDENVVGYGTDAFWVDAAPFNAGIPPVTGVGIQSGGSSVGTGITVLNFIGTGNTFAISGTTANISIVGGGGGAGVSSTGILTCRGIANAEDIIESIALNDFYGGGTNYAMVGPITVSGAGTTVTVGAGVSYVII